MLYTYSRHAEQQESIAAAKARAEADERARKAEAEAQAKAAAEARQRAEAEAKREQARRDAEALLQRAAEEQRRKAEEERRKAEEERRRAEAEAAKAEAIARAEREERERKAELANTLSELETARQALTRYQKELEEADRVVKLVEDAKVSKKPDNVIQLPRDGFEFDENKRPTKYVFYSYVQQDKMLARVKKERDNAQQNVDRAISTIRNLEVRLKTLQATDKK